jgi:hypothetical protein
MDTELLSDTFVDLADTMVADFDVIDFLHLLTDRSVALLPRPRPGSCWPTRAASCVSPRPPASKPGCWSCSSCRTTRGPAWNASAPAGPSPPPTWPARPRGGPGSRRPPRRPGSGPWRPGRCSCGARLGALNLFRAEPGPLDPADLRIAQALADVATIGLLQERNVRRR